MTFGGLQLVDISRVKILCVCVCECVIQALIRGPVDGRVGTAVGGNSRGAGVNHLVCSG